MKHSLKLKNKFIACRAAGASLRQIAQHLGIAKSTAQEWAVKHRAAIEAIRQTQNSDPGFEFRAEILKCLKTQQLPSQLSKRLFDFAMQDSPLNSPVNLLISLLRTRAQLVDSSRACGITGTPTVPSEFHANSKTSMNTCGLAAFRPKWDENQKIKTIPGVPPANRRTLHKIT